MWMSVQHEGEILRAARSFLTFGYIQGNYLAILNTSKIS